MHSDANKLNYTIRTILLILGNDTNKNSTESKAIAR